MPRTLTKHITLLQALATMPAALTCAFDDVDEAMAHQIPAASERSMAEIMVKWIEVEACYRTRLERVVQEERPVLPAWPDGINKTVETELSELTDRFQIARKGMLVFLEARSPAEWQRPAIHETYGRTNFHLLVQNLVDHDTLRLNQLLEIKKNLQATAVEDGIQSPITTYQSPTTSNGGGYSHLNRGE